MAKKQNIYRGFSSRNYEDKGSFIIRDIECVKEDLLNHIYTIVGERCMMPAFGTRIPLMVFDQNDAQVHAIIENDLKMVFDYDPRVQLLDLSVVPLIDNNAIVAVATLRYVEFDVVDTLHLEFANR